MNIKNDIITVFDNGGIEVVKSKTYGEWIPELVFSNLKAGSNFNDDEKRTTSGQNGYGSVLTAIFQKNLIYQLVMEKIFLHKHILII